MLFSTDWLTKLQYEQRVGQKGTPTYRHTSRSCSERSASRVWRVVSRHSEARVGLTS